jgi:hypothetical protein
MSAILKDAGFDSVDELLGEIANLEQQLIELENDGLGDTERAKSARTELLKYKAAKDEYDSHVNREKSASGGDMESVLADILDEAQVDNFEDLVTEINRLREEIANGGRGGKRVSNLRKLLDRYVGCVESTTGDTVEKFLRVHGYGSVDKMRKDCIKTKELLQELERAGKETSIRANSAKSKAKELDGWLCVVDTLISDAARVKSLAGTVTDIPNPAAADVAVGAPEMALPDSSGSLCYNIDIFHDVENCTCEAGLNLDARKVWNETQYQILTAFLSRPNTDRQSVEEQVRQMKLASAVHCKWYFCIRLDTTNPYHPSQAFVTDLDLCGATHVSVSVKKDAADNKLSQLMTSYRRDYMDRSVEAKRKSIAVLISSDSDFCKDITSFNQLGCCVVILYDGSKAKDIFKSSVEDRYSLDVWSTIISRSSKGGYRPRVADHAPAADLAPNSYSPGDFDGTQDNEFKVTLFALANFMFKSSNGICFTMEMFSNFQQSNATAKAVIEKHGGCVEFCILSQGAIRYDPRGSLAVSLPYLIKFFVAFKGGRLPANEIRDFYHSFSMNKSRVSRDESLGVVGKVKELLRKCGRIKGACLSTNGEMVWEDHPGNEEIGHGYLVIPSRPPNPEEVEKWPIGWPQWNYLDRYKLEIADELARVSRNVAMTLTKEQIRDGAKGCVVLTVTIEEDDDSPNDRSMLVRDSIAKRFLPASKDCINLFISKLGEFRGAAKVKREVLETDSELKRLTRENKIYIFLPRFSQDIISNEVVMRIPNKWTIPVRPAGGNRHAPLGGKHARPSPPDPPTLAELRERVYQFLENERLANREQITECRIVKDPVYHMKFTVGPDLRSKLLTYSGSSGVKFTPSFDTVDTVVFQNFNLVYRKTELDRTESKSNTYHDISRQVPDHINEGVKACLKRINELVTVLRVVDVFNTQDVPDTRQHRPAVEQDFFSNAVWNFVCAEVEHSISSDVSVIREKKVNKNVVQISGFKHLVDLTETYLKQRGSQMLRVTLVIPKRVQSTELVNLLKDQFAKILDATKEPESEATQGDDDNSSEV